MKHLLIILFFFPQFLLGQTPIIDWDQTYGFSKNDIANAMVETPDGGYLLAGMTQAKGRYDMDILLLRMDINGEILWEKRMSTPAIEIIYDLQASLDGNYILVGTTASSNNDVDILVIKITADGNQIWRKKIGGKGNDEGRGITMLPDSSFVIVGTWVATQLGTTHGYLCRMNSDGAIIWEQTYGGDHFPKLEKGPFEIKFGLEAPAGEQLNKVTYTTDGHLMALGNSLYHGKNRTATDLWLIKTDLDGQLIWEKAFGAIGGDDGLDIFEKADSTVIVIGEYYNKPAGRIGMWMFNLDRNGEVLWDQVFNKSNFPGDQINKVAERSESKSDRKYEFDGGVAGCQTKDGNLLLLGYHNQLKDGNLSPDETNMDIWLMCTNKDGRPLWQKTFGGPADEKGFSILQNKNGKYVFAGFTRSKGKGLKDVWITQLDFLRP